MDLAALGVLWQNLPPLSRPSWTPLAPRDQSKMAAHPSQSLPLIGFPLRPLLEIQPRRGPRETRREKSPPTKFQIDFDLCIVYIILLKGT